MITERKKIDLPTPLPIPGGVIRSRELLIFTHNNISFELSPLPGVSSETLAEAHLQILPYLDKLEVIENSRFSSYDLTRPLFNLIELNETLLPSVLFCLEQYLFLKCQIHTQQKTVKVHHLIPDLKLFTDLKDGEVYKCKIGKYSINEEVQIIKNILSNNNVILRLDGNRAFTQEQFLKYLPLATYTTKSSIDYFEEPLRNINDYNGPHFPLAIDESFHSFDAIVQLKHYEVKALVYKPTIMGGISTLISFIKNQPIKHLPICISSSFEGPVGHTFMKLFASYTDSIGPVARHGLVHIE